MRADYASDRNVAPLPAGSDIDAQARRLDILCRRAERLIQAVHMAHQQVVAMFGRPDRIIADANATAQQLLGLKTTLEPALRSAEQVGRSCQHQLDLVQHKLLQTSRATQAIMQRVQQGSELAERVAKQATFEDGRQNQLALGEEQRRLIAAGESAVKELRAALEAAHDLAGDSGTSAAALEALLKRSRRERLAWERFFVRLPKKQRQAQVVAGSVLPECPQGGAGPGAGGPAAALEPAGHSPPPSGSSHADALARRIRRLGDLIHQAGDEGMRPSPSPTPAPDRPVRVPPKMNSMRPPPTSDSRMG